MFKFDDSFIRKYLKTWINNRKRVEYKPRRFGGMSSLDMQSIGSPKYWRAFQLIVIQLEFND